MRPKTKLAILAIISGTATAVVLPVIAHSDEVNPLPVLDGPNMASVNLLPSGELSLSYQNDSKNLLECSSFVASGAVVGILKQQARNGLIVDFANLPESSVSLIVSESSRNRFASGVFESNPGSTMSVSMVDVFGEPYFLEHDDLISLVLCSDTSSGKVYSELTEGSIPKIAEDVTGSGGFPLGSTGSMETVGK